jgi:hypothetical protein
MQETIKVHRPAVHMPLLDKVHTSLHSINSINSIHGNHSNHSNHSNNHTPGCTAARHAVHLCARLHPPRRPLWL